MEQQDRQLVTAKAILKEFGMPRSTLYWLANTGAIPCHEVTTRPWRLRRLFRFQIDEVRAALANISGGEPHSGPPAYKGLVGRYVVGDLRAEVIARDRARCRYCDADLEGKMLCIDHIVPYVRGGRTEADNLATACKECNSRKSDRTPEEAGMALLPLPE